MKNRPIVYAQKQYAETSEPQYVVSIEFAPASFEYFASHTGIADIPAGVIESCVEDFSSVSQSFDPETGASRIGSLTVMLGDIGGAITDAFQARLVAGNGVRDKQLRLYKGFEGMSFNDFELKWTQDVHEVSEDHARYKISCSDLQRAMRTEIFGLKNTVLDATLSATASTATVADTNEFILVEHGTSYSDGPSATWGYFKVDDEVIGYTGKTATTFTGLARGRFNTEPAEHKVDGADPPERRPEVEEYVYLEMPIPKMVKALLTGVLHGQGAATLPAHWHMGIDINLIEDSQFTGIGIDLWDPANDAVGLPAKFTEIDSIDGKQFIEKECFLLAQIFSPVLSDGKLGLRRFTPALARASHLVTLNESNVQKHTSLKHSMRAVFNRIVLNWSWIAGEFRRQTIKLDTDSIAKHGEAPIKIYNFRGLASNIATQSVLTQRFDAIRDRFSAPPLSMNVDVSKSLDRMELGDVCLVQLPNVRDMAATTVNPIDRAFEIRQIRENRKRLTFVLEGSSAEAIPVAPVVDALPDAFYDQEGTELSTVVTITAGVTATGTFTLVGAALLKDSVFYYVGNLTIAADTTLNLDDNVQLRVRGFLTVNGILNGVARGLAGIVDGITLNDAPPGTAAFFGSTIGGDGALDLTPLSGYLSRPPGGGVAIGFSSAPFLNLDVSGNTLNGLPSQLRGSSGGPGGKLADGSGQVGAGGTGGPGGSGLMIICRGLSFGGGASIDLSGGDGLSALQKTLGGKQFFGGGGGGGAPGAFYVLLDGNRLVPDIPSVFIALGGNTPIDGTPLARFLVEDATGLPEPATGFRDDTRRIDDVDWTDGAFRVQFVPIEETPVEDLPDTDLTVHYILATNGNAIHNGTGTLTLEAHRLLAGSDELLSTGTIKLFDPSNNEVTVANGYVTGSDGYTGILDSGDITGDIVITLKDGPTGPPLDTITLVDVADGATGAPGSDGADAVYGVIEPENGLAWTRATNSGAWTPSQATTDLDCTFFQGGVEVARIARRITLNTADGTLTAAAIAHKGGDLNTARVNVTLIGNGSTAETVQFDYSFGGEDASVSETVSTSQSGDDGASSHGVLVNGGFETGDNTGWTVSATGVIINDGTARTGTYYMRIDSGAGGPNHISTRYAAPAVGREVRISGFARRDESDQPTTNGSIAVRFYDSSDIAVGGRITVQAADFNVADWQALSGVAVVPATAVSFAFDCGESSGSGAWEFDDLSATIEAAPAVTGVVEPENGIAWTRAPNAGAWTPSQLTTDLDCKFTIAGVEVARIARRITLTSGTGALAATSIVHKDGDLNTSRVTVTVSGGGSTAITVQFDYADGLDIGSIAQTVTSSQSGDDGATGDPGADGADAITGFVEAENGLAWTRAPNAGAWTPSQLTTDLDVTFTLGGTVVARIARRITLTSGDGTLAATSTAHKGGDLNISRVTVTVTGGGSTAITAQFDYSFSGDTGSAGATVESAQGGDDGTDGTDGTDGDDAISSSLTNEAHVAPADSDGTGVDLTGSGGTHKVLDGTTDVTASATHSIVGGSGSPSEKTQNGLKISVVVATGIYAITETTTDSWTTDIETFTLRAVFGGVTSDKVYTIAKAKRGEDLCTFGELDGTPLVNLVADPANANCGYRLNSDGKVYTRQGFGAWIAQETWKGDCANSEYEARMTLISGDSFTSGPSVNVWHLLSTTRTWELEQLVIGNKSNENRPEIRRIDDNIIGQSATGSMLSDVFSL